MRGKPSGDWPGLSRAGRWRSGEDMLAELVGWITKSLTEEAEDFDLSTTITEQPPNPFAAQWRWPGVGETME